MPKSIYKKRIDEEIIYAVQTCINVHIQQRRVISTFPSLQRWIYALVNNATACASMASSLPR